MAPSDTHILYHQAICASIKSCNGSQILSDIVIIHHLNVRIPFYRLPEAMVAIPELQLPLTTTLSMKEIIDCFHANLWDEEKQRMISYQDVLIK